jgi:ketosteroid isomerase-like protein
MAPPETYFSGQPWTSDVREVVERFYEAARTRDAASIAELVDERFAAEAVVREPESLPFGGAHEGVDAIKALFDVLYRPGSESGLADVSVETIIESAGESDKLDHVVVALAFGSLRGEPGRALQWWTFHDFRVVEIRTFYWDTAALGIT